MSAVSRWVLAALSLGVAPSCMPAALKAEFENLKNDRQASGRTIAEMKLEQARQASQLENLERMWWSEKLCRNPKNPEFPKRVAQFLNEIQSGIPGTCAQGSLENALFFMNSQPYCNAYLRPSEPVETMHAARKGQLASLLDPKYLYPSTRFMVLVQPTDESEPSREQALQLGQEYAGLMRRLSPEKELKILGPFLLPCRLRSEVARLFHGPMDTTLPREPTEGAKRVRVWAFRSDCL